ncbi:hypothetical protein C5S31_00990 [ANME-1 cluster archaeon GoMg2]|nr:hypothetical protein [ANME-1 cluster archaeon GoMg2]
MMELEEQNMINAILEDVENLKGRVEGMEGMLETIVEIYTDAFYVVKEEYLEKSEKIRKECDFETFSDIEDLRKLIEED